jgi:hypothetical protein
MKVARLNAIGLEQFGNYLDSIVGTNLHPIPSEILTDPATSELLEHDIEIEQLSFARRFEMAEYLVGKLSVLDNSRLEKDAGIWAWLALYYFEQLCTVDSNGLARPGARAKWIPETKDFRRYYRHLLAGPYQIYRAHRDNPQRALVLLCGSLNRPGEIVEQITSRQELITNKAVIEAATKLYIDPNTEQPKSGAAGKGGGSARRLAEILNQYELTWDLSIIAADDLFNMLPREFDKFQS